MYSLSMALSQMTR